jgi:hypothetical protein
VLEAYGQNIQRQNAIVLAVVHVKLLNEFLDIRFVLQSAEINFPADFK